MKRNEILRIHSVDSKGFPTIEYIIDGIHTTGKISGFDGLSYLKMLKFPVDIPIDNSVTETI